MQLGELEAVTKKVEDIVDKYISTKKRIDDLVLRNKELERKVASLEKDLRRSEKEVGNINEVMARNKAYEKNHRMLKSRVASMLAKVDSLQ